MTIIDEIEICLEQDMYMSALMLSLTIPDICGKVEYPNEKQIAPRYIRWYNKYMEQYKQGTSAYDIDLPYLSGEVVYNLRKSVIHSGNPNIDYTKVKQEEWWNKVEFLLMITKLHQFLTKFQMPILKRVLQY